MIQNILNNTLLFCHDHGCVTAIIAVILITALLNIGSYFICVLLLAEGKHEDKSSQNAAIFSMIAILATVGIAGYNLTTPAPAGNVVELNLLGFFLAFFDIIFVLGSLASNSIID